MHLETAKDDFFKNTNDLAQNSNSKNSDNSKTFTFKKMMGDYDDHQFSFESNMILESLHLYGKYASKNLLSSPHISPEQPPDEVQA